MWFFSFFISSIFEFLLYEYPLVLVLLVVLASIVAAYDIYNNCVDCRYHLDLKMRILGKNLLKKWKFDTYLLR